MSAPLVLASGSPTRHAMLSNAGVAFEAATPRVDEFALRDGLAAEGVAPRDIADALAEAKAQRIAAKRPEAVVLGADQVLGFGNEALGKPADRAEARAQLLRLAGQRHMLYSAAVIFRDGTPVWRHVGEARLTMRALSEAAIDAYLARQGDMVTETAGGYRIEGAGVRLFARVEGDHFSILGLPLVAVLNYLTDCGILSE